MLDLHQMGNALSVLLFPSDDDPEEAALYLAKMLQEEMPSSTPPLAALHLRHKMFTAEQALPDFRGWGERHFPGSGVCDNGDLVALLVSNPGYVPLREAAERVALSAARPQERTFAHLGAGLPPEDLRDWYPWAFAGHGETGIASFFEGECWVWGSSSAPVPVAQRDWTGTRFKFAGLLLTGPDKAIQAASAHLESQARCLRAVVRANKCPVCGAGLARSDEPLPFSGILGQAMVSVACASDPDHFGAKALDSQMGEEHA